jgi:toxin ParE1/3/4
MTWLMLVRPEAEQDLAAARDWYDQKRAGLGDEFLDAVAVAIRELANHPERARRYFRNFRRLLLLRFPYKVFYQVIGERVVVFRMLHAKENHERGLSGT